MRVTQVGGAALAAVAAACVLTACGEPAHHEADWNAMGAEARAVVFSRTAADAELAVDEIHSRIAEVGAELDPEGSAGLLARLNREAADGFFEIAEVDLYVCVTQALDYARESGGAYDPTLGSVRRLWRARHGTGAPVRPGEVDAALSVVGWPKVTVAPEARAIEFRVPGLAIELGSVAHGCALDVAVRTFARPGSLGGLLQLGGVYRAWGAPAGAERWSVEVQDPRSPDRVWLTLDVAGRGFAVAGHAEGALADFPPDGPAFLDGRSGQPVASDVLAALAVADSAADAAAIVHALFALGPLQGPALLGRLRRTEAAILVRDSDGRPPYMLASVSLRDRLELSVETRAELSGEVRWLLPPARVE